MKTGKKLMVYTGAIGTFVGYDAKHKLYKVDCRFDRSSPHELRRIYWVRADEFVEA